MKYSGFSWEEIERHTDLVIRVHGFMAQQVSGAERAWTYTVGITESWDHPELLCVDGPGETQANLIGVTADDIEEFGAVRPATLESHDIELVPVEERHLRYGLVASWEARYQRSAATGDFLRIVLGTSSP